jgi:hypothetical protein
VERIANRCSLQLINSVESIVIAKGDRGRGEPMHAAKPLALPQYYPNQSHFPVFIQLLEGLNFQASRLKAEAAGIFQ